MCSRNQCGLCDAAAQASAYICDRDAGSATANGLATSTAIAEATATAIASVFAECTAGVPPSFWCRSAVLGAVPTSNNSLANDQDEVLDVCGVHGSQVITNDQIQNQPCFLVHSHKLCIF